MSGICACPTLPAFGLGVRAVKQGSTESNVGGLRSRERRKEAQGKRIAGPHPWNDGAEWRSKLPVAPIARLHFTALLNPSVKTLFTIFGLLCPSISNFRMRRIWYGPLATGFPETSLPSQANLTL